MPVRDEQTQLLSEAGRRVASPSSLALPGELVMNPVPAGTNRVACADIHE